MKRKNGILYKGTAYKSTVYIRKTIAGCMLFAAGFLLLFLSDNIPGLADWYAEYIYPVIVNTVGRFFGLFPFSVSEVMIYLLVLGILLTALWLIIRLVRRRTKKGEAADYLSALFLTAGVLFLIYTVNCGINYNRTSFSERSGIQTRAYSAEDLKAACKRLTEDVNTYASQVPRDDARVMRLDGTEKREAVTAIKRLGDTYPEFAGYYPKPKGFLCSYTLSIQNLTGIYLPFTVEANYNTDMTDYNIPFTACHELSHLRGFMQEEEANFIAYLACMESRTPEFRYSGSLLAWIYCTNALQRADYEAYREIREGLSEEAEADLKANHVFWARYDGKTAEVANMVNDTYLKANGQEDGVQSYGRMVDLLVSYLGEEPG